MNKTFKSLLFALLLIAALATFAPTQSVQAYTDNCKYQRYNDIGSVKYCPVTATTGLRYVTPDPVVQPYTLWGAYSDVPSDRYMYLVSVKNVNYAYDKYLGIYWQYTTRGWVRVNLPWY